MRVQAFNGGKNTRVAPHLLPINVGVEYLNIDNETGELKPVKKKAVTGLTLGEWAHYFEAQSTWVSSNIERDYLEYQDTLYYTEVGAVPKQFDGVSEKNLGISAPTIAPLTFAAGLGNLTGTYQYLYTFYDSSIGMESAPSPIASDLAVTSKAIQLDNLEVSTDPSVDKKRIYRVGGNIAIFSLVATINNSEITYLDNIADVDIPGDVLNSTTYYQAPLGLRYLVETYGILFGAVGDKLRYSATGIPWAWPETNLIDFPAEITGIGIVPAGILVFTKLKTHIITGTEPQVFVVRSVDENQGCVSHKSIQNIKNGLIWVSLDGICRSGGVVVDVLSLDLLSTFSINVKNSKISDSVYYIHDTNGTITAVDFRYTPQVIKNLDLDTTNITTGNNLLLGYKSGVYYELFKSSAYTEFTYLSPVFLDGSYTNRKNYNSVYIYAEPPVTVKVFLDKKKVLEQTLTTEDCHELRWEQTAKNGYAVQLQITGSGIVKEIDFKPEGRTTI